MSLMNDKLDEEAVSVARHLGEALIDIDGGDAELLQAELEFDQERIGNKDYSEPFLMGYVEGATIRTDNATWRIEKIR